LQDPEAVAIWRPRLEAALQYIVARNLISGRNFRARNRQKRIEAGARLCETCNLPLAGRRADARFCSDKCRVRANRRRQRGVMQ
jgi:hypothetical protein